MAAHIHNHRDKHINPEASLISQSSFRVGTRSEMLSRASKQASKQSDNNNNKAEGYGEAHDADLWFPHVHAQAIAPTCTHTYAYTIHTTASTNQLVGAGEMAPRLRDHTVLPEDSGSNPSTDMTAYNCL